MEADAINALEGTSYHQEGRTVDNYLNNFQAITNGHLLFVMGALIL